jgi:hypothetical protein
VGFGEADIAAIMADLAEAGACVEVQFDGQKTQGLYDHEAVEILGAEMPAIVAADQVVHIQQGQLQGLDSGALVIVDGVSYRILKALPYGDGAMVRVALRQP